MSLQVKYIAKANKYFCLNRRYVIHRLKCFEINLAEHCIETKDIRVLKDRQYLLQ